MRRFTLFTAAIAALTLASAPLAANAVEPDTTIPQVTIDHVDPYLTAVPGSIGYQVIDDDIDSLQCGGLRRAGGAVKAAWSLPCTEYLVPAQGDGAHELVVTAYDLAGHQASAQVNFIVDGFAPVVSLTSAPDSLATSSSAEFEFGVDEGPAAPQVAGVDEFQCALDDVQVDDCASGLVLDDLAEGDHTFTVIAVDRAGNTSQLVSHAWTVDTVDPAVTIDDAPPARTSLTDAVLQFSVSDTGSGLDRVECTIDGVTSTCADEVALADLADGEHDFTVTAYDLAGNSSSADATWIVDTVAPDTVFTVVPGAASGATATFEFSSPDPVASRAVAAVTTAFECALDDAAFESCTSPITLDDLEVGPHSFAVRAIDVTGNVDGTPASFEWSVEAAAAPSGLANTGASPAPWIALALTLLGAGGLFIVIRRRTVEG